jgi:ABC-type lipoprotein export system ATPase subunit
MTLDTSVVVECSDVSRTFGSGRQASVAVHGATCALERARPVAIVGRSGSGKSSLLHLLAGLDRPTSGRMRWPGIGDRPGRQAFGVVLQGSSLLPFLDMLDNAAMTLVLGGVDVAIARRRALPWLETLGVADVAGSLPSQVSGGQAQRVAVARALASGPALIVADEPTGQLDRDAADLVTDVLVATAIDTGAALVLATHDDAVAARVGRRWSMVDGRLHTDLGASGS